MVPVWRAVRPAASQGARHEAFRAQAWLGLWTSPPQCGTTGIDAATAAVDDKESFHG